VGLTTTATARAAISDPNALVLGEDEDTRTLDEKYPVTVTVRPIPQPRPDSGNTTPRAGAQEPGRRLFGLLGRKREEPRFEPAGQRASQQQRATGQAVNRPLGEELRPQQSGQQPDDLFPDHKRDDQFEIPAFLRRQSS